MGSERNGEKFCVGILGAANVAIRYVIPALMKLDHLYSVITIASRSEEKLGELAKEFNINFTNCYDDIIDDKSIDIVYIPLPNALHYIWVKKALLAGKHVLVEKSMACNVEDVVELNEIAKSKHLALVENFQFRFHSQLKLIKDIISSGSLGGIRNIKSNFGFPPFNDINNIRYSKELGGGALLDAGAYPLKLARILLGESIYVDSASLYYEPSIDVDTWGSAQIKCKSSKVVMQCSFGFDNSYLCNVEVWGSKGILNADRIFTSPPDNKAMITLKNSQEIENFEVAPENHFVNMLVYFHGLCNDNISLDREYSDNILQAKLIHQLREQSYE